MYDFARLIDHTWWHEHYLVFTQLDKIDKMVMINGEGDLGASKVTAEVSRVMTQVPDVVESLTGVHLKGMLAGVDSR